MDKLKNLQTSSWIAIETQADYIFNLIQEEQKKNKIVNQIRIKGKIHEVNKAILKTNGFTVYETDYDYYTNTPDCIYRISW